MKKMIIYICFFIICINSISTIGIKNSNYKINANDDTYDMVVISPEIFSEQLIPLINHKNIYGIETYLKTLEDIYNEFEGRDKPEQIKYFIKYAIETCDIKYVLLIGGLKSLIYAHPKDDSNHGSNNWYLPVRYTNMIEPSKFQVYDPGFISDLYFADIYDINGNFSSWDTNENNIFAEWNMRKINEDIDELDFFPDVSVGRLPCRNRNELKTVIDKIIRYETSSSDREWFNRFIVAGSDPLNDFPTNYPEGEILGDHIIENYMSNFQSVRLYGSYKNSNYDMIPKYENILRELELGCGFFLLDAHGSPARTATYYPGDFNQNNMINCLSVYNLPLINNLEKLPIIVCGGCWCSQFNVSFLGNYFSNYQYFGRITPECIGWSLVRKNNGGGIATLGFTALGYIRYIGENGDIDNDGIDEPDYVENGWGYLESCFFDAIHEGEEILGDAWRNAETKYLQTSHIDNKNDWQEAKDILAWVLLGDPSLKIGGYN
jgi:hypothetical protein